MKKFEIDFKDKSQMCKFNCGVNWGNNKFTPNCGGCMIACGYNYTDMSINKLLPDLESSWKTIEQNKIVTETKLKATEAELHKTQAALKSSEDEKALLKIGLEKFKAKALEEQETLKRQAIQTFKGLKLKAVRAQIETINAKSHALDLQKQIERLEMHKHDNEAGINILKTGIATVTDFYTIKGEVVKVVEAEAQAQAKRIFSVSDIIKDPTPEI